MTAQVSAHPNDMASMVGQRLGVSEWQEVTQERIGKFADVTGDHQWIHLDAERARTGPFGAPVAHGYLLISLLPGLLAGVIRMDGIDLMINKGMDRLRFLEPVRAGTRVRATADLVSVTPRPRGFTELVLTVTAEIEGGTQPAFIARSRILVHAREQTGTGT